MAAKMPKKNRQASATLREAAGNISSGIDFKRHKFTIWPEWSDADVNAEKWEATKKDDKKTKSPTQLSHHAFEDPDGKLELPHSLKADSWKRPGEFIRDKIPVIVDTEHTSSGFDLITTNDHLNESEFLRHCMSQITALWEMLTVNHLPPENMLDILYLGGDPMHSWCPWEHIYSHCKAGKGPHLPLFNSYGKYVVRLYWMGCWRKITIDDSVPFDSQGRMLLPSTTLQHELWPMLLTKALMKIAFLDYTGGNPSQEFGDMSIIQCLTGWIPEAIPLQQGHMNEVWELLKATLPEWKLPLQEWEKPSEIAEVHNKDVTDSILKEEKEERHSLHKDGREKGKEKKEQREKASSSDKGAKDDKKDKKEKGSKTKEREKLHGEEKSIIEEYFVPEKPEVVIFATYGGNTSKYPVKVSVLGDMADASEKLRQNGLSHNYSHPVYIAQTRSCPLDPPPPPVIVPSWKLIRPRKKKDPPHDEPVPGPEEPKQIQCLELTSPFINYKISQMPIPTDTHRPKSALERRGTRSRAEESTIEEGEENAPTPPPVVVPEPKIIAHTSVKEEEPQKEMKHSGTKHKMSMKMSKDTKSSSVQKNRTLLKHTDSDGEKTADAKQDKRKESITLDHPVFGESGGLAPPASSHIEIREETDMVEVMMEEMPIVPSSSSIWMDFDVFMKCFRTLYVYHKSNTYLCNQRFSDLKSVSLSAVSLTNKGERKSHPAVAVPNDSSAPIYLFVDSLAPTDILVSFSVLARWFDPQFTNVEERKSSVHVKSIKERDNDKESTTMSQSLDDRAEQKSQSVTPGTLVAEPYSWKSLVTGQPILRLKTTGTKSAVMRLPPGRHVLRFLVNSPLGYHVHMCSTVNFILGDEETVMPQLTNESLCFHENAVNLIKNLGKCILAFSDSKEMELAWQDLIKSHCPYLSDRQMSKTHHFQIFNEALYSMLRKSIKDIITPEVAFAWRALLFDVTTPNILELPLGSRPDSAFGKKRRKVSAPTLKAESMRSLDVKIKSNRNLDSLELNSQGNRGAQTLSLKTSNESKTALDQEHLDSKATASHRSSGKVSVKKRGGNQVAVSVPDSQIDAGDADKSEYSISSSSRQPSVCELVAAVKIQTAWRGYYVKKINVARTPGTFENEKASDKLRKCWSMIEANLEENGLFLLREMFKKDPEIMPHYPFYKDEWSKISYADYKGTFPDQPPNSWFLIFRDVFYVKDEMLVVPSVQVSTNTCILHVIDNDTGMETPRVFQKVAPYVYKRNKKGYSFVAEARTMEQPLASSIWRLRLIGSLSALPTPRTGDVCCNFMTKDIRDYYVPNSKNIIFRQSVKVKEDLIMSLQMNTSKRGVYFKLAILDNEEEVISSVGKGHVVIPVFTFLKNITQDDIEQRRSGSRASEVMEKDASGVDEIIDENANKTSPPSAATKVEKSANKTKRAESVISADQQPLSRNSIRSEAELAERLEDTRVHKYIIQATVLQNSWPLSESSWKFVQTLKEIEKNELKLSSWERPVSPPKVEKVQSSTSKGKVIKGGKERVVRDKGSLSSSQQFDLSKPHWTLRVVSDAAMWEEIEVKKDMERAEEIKAMKKAWEDAEPGRAAKALQSRLKYLNSHTIKVIQSEDYIEPTKVVESVSTINVVNAVSDGSTAGTETEASTDTEIVLPAQTVPAVFFNESETSLTLEPPPSLHPKELLEPVDITPFIRKTLPEPLYVDEEVFQKLMEKRQKEIYEFKIFREEVEKWREADRQNRNNAKISQLQQYQALQTALDEARDTVNIPREAIRKRFLEIERCKLEELAQEAAAKAENEASSPKTKRRSPVAKKKVK